MMHRIAFALSLVAVPAQAQTLLIGNKGEDTVSFVDLRTGSQCARVGTGKSPHEVAISPDGRQAAVVAYGGSGIDIFDVARARLVRRIDIAPNAGPHGLAWIAPRKIVVAADRSGTVVTVDPRSGRFSSVATGQIAPHMLAVSPRRDRAYTANIGSGTVSVIDLTRQAKLSDIAVGGRPEAVALTPDGRQLWVGDNSAPRMRVLDPQNGAVLASLPTDSVAFRVAISPDGRTAVSSNLSSGTLNLFDTASLRPLRTITVSGDPKAMQVTLAFSPDGARLYVAETMKNTVAEVDMASGAVLRRIAAGRNGDGLGISPRRCVLPRSLSRE